MSAQDLAVLDEVGAFVVLLTQEGEIAWWNQECVAVTGFEVADLPSRHIGDLVLPDERGAVMDALKRTLEDGGAAFEYHLLPREGRPRLVAWSSRLSRRDGASHVLATGIDRTDEVAAVTALRASEEKLRTLTNISAEGIVWLDEQLRITLFNEGAERALGFRAEDVLKSPVDVIIPEAQRAQAHEVFRRFLRSPARSLRVGVSDDVRARRADGSELPVDIMIAKIRDREGWTFVATLRDISYLKRRSDEQRFFIDVTDRLASAETQRDALLVLAQLSVERLCDACVIDLGDDGRRFVVLHRDPEQAPLVDALTQIRVRPRGKHPLARILKSRSAYVLEDVTDKDLRDFAQSPHHYQLLQALGPRSVLAVPLLARDDVVGVLTLYSTTSRRFKAADLAFGDELGRRVGLALDNARLREARERAVRARDEVLGVVAHDLRSPLSAIQLTATALSAGDDLDEEKRRSLDLIRRSGERMASLIDDLLDVARMDAGKVRLSREPCEGGRLIEEAVQACRSGSEAAGVALSATIPGEPVSVFADALRCLQILENLIQNAIKFTPPGGRVDVALGQRGGFALFSVSDTGPGVAWEHRDKLFEPFWQRQRGAAKDGAGLGLAIARGLVVAHGGEIGVDSVPGRGSTFWFTLPLWLAARPSATRATEF